MNAPLDTKAKFFTAWSAGLLGYKLRTWDTLAEFQAEPNKPPICGFRQLGTSGGGAFEMAHGTQAVEETAAKWTALGRRYMICEAAPDEKATIQGEVVRTERGLEGYLGSSKLRMRDAIAQGILQPRGWLETRMLIAQHMWPGSQEDLWCLLDSYPDHVIEFTCYDHRFEPGRNTIFWEVRKY